MEIDVKKFADQFIYEISDSNYFDYANIQLMLVLLEVFPQYIYKSEVAARFAKQFQTDIIEFFKEADPDYYIFVEEDTREHDDQHEVNNFCKTITIASKNYKY